MVLSETKPVVLPAAAGVQRAQSASLGAAGARALFDTLGWVTSLRGVGGSASSQLSPLRIRASAGAAKAAPRRLRTGP